MWSVALISLLIIGQISALPMLPLSATGVGKLDTLSHGEENARTFIVKEVEVPQVPSTEPKQPEQTREFPWPYPPVFEKALPMEAKQRLIQVYIDSTITSEERAEQVNAVFDSLTRDVLMQLPLPTEYERLPFDVYRRIAYIHVADGFKWAERQQLIRDIVESLPEEEKHLMQTPKIGGPPPQFAAVLAPTVYKQLLFVHHNPRLTKEQKSEMITRIMRQVPQEQINQLPLPNGFDQLPMELQTRARSLVYDYSVPQQIRAQKVREFVGSLPEQLRPQLR